MSDEKLLQRLHDFLAIGTTNYQLGLSQTEAKRLLALAEECLKRRKEAER